MMRRLLQVGAGITVRGFNKSFATTLLAGLVTVAGLITTPPLGDYLLNGGLFALSGALTNWLAIHMLFERVPGFYGSGVIQLRFEEFKHAIRELIMEQFFSRENIKRFFAADGEVPQKLDREISSMVDSLDLDSAFESLVEVIMNSSFGGMLGMFGGREALQPLKEPFSRRMKDYFRGVVNTDAFRRTLSESLQHSAYSDSLMRKIEAIVDRRLNELSPAQVRRIVQAMIREHLGWLVVWGGVLGGLIGLCVTPLT